MNELDTRAERFLESIRAEGEAACAAIRTETEAEVARQMNETRKAEEAKAEHTLRYETERSRTRANRDLSAARMQARAELAAERQKLADAVFAEAESRLSDFAASGDYADWLRSDAARLCEAMGEGTVLSARAKDTALLAKLPAGVTVQADGSIRLGGLRAVNTVKGLAADDTLEARLAAQHDWFLQNAGLEIRM